MAMQPVLQYMTFEQYLLLVNNSELKASSRVRMG
jgi:hypothetical protein